MWTWNDFRVVVCLTLFWYTLPRALSRFVPFIAAQRKRCQKPQEFYQYSNSLCFSTGATIHSVYQLVRVYPAVPLHLWFQTSDAHWDASMQLERFVMLNLFAHLVADWVMEAQRDKPSLETYLHHFVFLSMGATNFHYRRWAWLFEVLIFGELSSLFLALRWFSIKTRQTNLLWHFNVGFAATFFFARILVLGWALSFVARNDSNIFADYELWQINPIGIVVAFGLNAYWFRVIVTNAFAGASHKTQL